jgi:PAT family beta-lactamase induction signal transducer AmpG
MGLRHDLPALADNSGLRYFALACLYVAQGLPFGLISFALPALMAEQGLAPVVIGRFLGISFLPWTFKLVAAAIIDRWAYLAMGRRRPWILVGQLGIVISLALVALRPAPLDDLEWLTMLCALLNGFAAFQDTATDAMAIELVPADQQSRANGIMWGAKTVGAAAATAGGAWMFHARGMDAAFLATAVLVALLMLVPLCLRERACERLLPWTRGQASEVAASLQQKKLADVWSHLLRAAIKRTSVLVTAASFLFHVALGLVAAVLPVYAVQELGWSALSFSGLVASSRLSAGLLVVILAGALAVRAGQLRLLRIGGIALVASVLAMAVFPGLWVIDSAMTVFQFGFQFVATMLIVLFLAISMSICVKTVSAVQFALYTAAANLGLAVGPILLGPIQSRFGYAPVFFFVAGFFTLMLALLRRVRLDADDSSTDHASQSRKQVPKMRTAASNSETDRLA